MYITGTAIKNLKGFKTIKGTPIQIKQEATPVTYNEEINQALVLCKQNPFILNSGTLFYKKKNRYPAALKTKLRQLSKIERKNI